MYPVMDMEPNRDQDFGIEHAAQDKAVRRTVKASIRNSGKDIGQIAKEMRLRLRQAVTGHMLYGYTRKDDERPRFPAAFVDGFSEVTGDDQLARIVMGPRLVGLVRLGEALIELGEVDPKAARLVRRLSRNRSRKKGRA
jgi:hypothetical protein